MKQNITVIVEVPTFFNTANRLYGGGLTLEESVTIDAQRYVDRIVEMYHVTHPEHREE